MLDETWIIVSRRLDEIESVAEIKCERMQSAKNRMAFRIAAGAFIETLISISNAPRY